MVHLKQKLPEQLSKLRKREVWLPPGSLQLALKVAQEDFGHSTEEPLDPTAAAGLTRCREDELHFQVDGDLLHVPRSEVRTMVRIEHSQDPANWPVWILLAPDALADCQCRCAARLGDQSQGSSPQPLG